MTRISIIDKYIEGIFMHRVHPWKKQTRISMWIHFYRCSYMDESQGYKVEQNEPDTKENILYIISFMKFMNSESIAFLIEVRLVLGRVLTVRENEGAFWILKMFSIISVTTWMYMQD